MEDCPKTLNEFTARFSTQDACRKDAMAVGKRVS